MASAKVSFTPSPHPAVTGYMLYSREDKYKPAKKVDLGMPEIDANGKVTVIVPEATLANHEYFVTAYNVLMEESVGSNIVKYDPRIDPPSELIVEDP